MSKTAKIILSCLVICVIIAIIPLMTISGEYGGSDDAAEGVISKIDKDYKPWFSSIYEPPSGEIESLLFCLQAAIGTGLFAYGMGYFVARKKYKK